MIKKFALLFSAAAVMFVATACDSDDDNSKQDPPITVADGTYQGTLVVDQNDGTYYTQDGVNVVITFTDGAAEIKMLKVSFSPKMPVKLAEMIIPGVTYTETESGATLAGDGIVPKAMGVDFAMYTIADLEGDYTTATLSFEMLCGQYPTSFTGERLIGE